MCERREQNGAGREQRENFEAEPAAFPRKARRKNERDKTHGEQEIRRGVEGQPPQGGRLSDRVHAGDEREDEYGQEREKDLTPTEGLDHPTAERRADRRCERADERRDAHHHARTVERRLLEHDVEHQRQRDARTRALHQPSEEQHREAVGLRPEQRADEEEDAGREEEAPHREPRFEKCGERNDDGQHEEIPRRDPLDDGDADVELRHQRRERDVHRRLNDNARKGHQPRCEQREQKFGVDAAREVNCFCHLGILS